MWSDDAVVRGGIGVAHALHTRVQREVNARGWPMRRLVEASGIPQSTIDRLRYGVRAPSARVVQALCTALDIDFDEGMFLAGRGQPGYASIDLRRAIETTTELTDQGRAAMLAMFDALQSGHHARQRSADHADTA